MSEFIKTRERNIREVREEESIYTHKGDIQVGVEGSGCNGLMILRDTYSRYSPLVVYRGGKRVEKIYTNLDLRFLKGPGELVLEGDSTASFFQDSRK